MRALAIWFLAIPLGFLTYAYLIYPLGLWVVTRFLPAPRTPPDPPEWPSVTITVPCYNEEASISRTLEGILALDYPRDRLHVLVISDASTDRTDEIVRTFESQGVELLRLPVRRGKTAAENAASGRLRGDIVVNTDATTRILPASLKRLIRVFGDPTIGVATGRAIATGNLDSATNRGEAGYTGYEMRVRSLETRAGMIVGASGCFFASRRALYASAFPETLSRDFASCLIAQENGFRGVSVEEAECLVPLSSSVRNEFRRKARTMARGLDTLWYKRHLLNPLRYGKFAWMLFSHKLARWLFQLTYPLLVVGCLLSAFGRPLALGALLISLLALALVSAMTIAWPEERRLPKLLAVAGYGLWANFAGTKAWLTFFQGGRTPIWEPTRRPAIPPGGSRLPS